LFGNKIPISCIGSYPTPHAALPPSLSLPSSLPLSSSLPTSVALQQPPSTCQSSLWRAPAFLCPKIGPQTAQTHQFVAQVRGGVQVCQGLEIRRGHGEERRRLDRPPAGSLGVCLHQTLHLFPKKKRFQDLLVVPTNAQTGACAAFPRRRVGAGDAHEIALMCSMQERWG